MSRLLDARLLECVCPEIFCAECDESGDTLNADNRARGADDVREKRGRPARAAPDVKHAVARAGLQPFEAGCNDGRLGYCLPLAYR